MIHRWVTLLALIGVLAGCVTETVKTTSVPTLSTYETELADDEILDIAVTVFDPGSPMLMPTKISTPRSAGRSHLHRSRTYSRTR